MHIAEFLSGNISVVYTLTAGTQNVHFSHTRSFGILIIHRVTIRKKNCIFFLSFINVLSTKVRYLKNCIWIFNSLQSWFLIFSFLLIHLFKTFIKFFLLAMHYSGYLCNKWINYSLLIICAKKQSKLESRKWCKIWPWLFS